MINKVFFAVFVVFWLFLFFFNIIIPKADFSEEENRMLAKWPIFTWEKLFNGEYAQEAEEFISDHFIFRNEWVIVKNLSEQIIGKTQINNVYIGKDGYLFEKIDYNSSNISNAVENIDRFARKIANTSLFYDSTKFNLYQSGKIT